VTYNWSPEELAGFEVTWEMLPTKADRSISMKSTSSCRLMAAYPGRNTYLYFESRFEFECAMYFWTQHTVVDVRTQYRVTYVDENGVQEHFFDLMVTFITGEIVLYACRPAGRDKDGEVEKALENIRNQTLRLHADRCEMLTDEDITEALVYRAREILRSRKFKNTANCDRLYKLLREIGKPIKVFQLQEQFGNEGAAWNAMWNLIDAGWIEHLAPDENSTLTELSWVKAVEYDA
jgi:hypothetical protein